MLNLKIQSNLLFLLLHISKACNQSHLFSAANCQMNLSKVQKIFHHLFFVAKGPDPSSFGSVIAPRSAPWGLNIFVVVLSKLYISRTVNIALLRPYFTAKRTRKLLISNIHLLSPQKWSQLVDFCLFVCNRGDTILRQRRSPH